MDNTILIEITNPRALNLLQELEELHLIKVLQNNLPSAKVKLSEKYKGVFSKEDARSFNEHTKTMRKEWSDI